jgi:hypothetical protein
MAMRAGTVDHFSNSLAEAIEDSLAAEMMAKKGQPLPPLNKDDRRMLFAAIAQGVLGYLRNHQSEIQVRLSGLPSGASASVRVIAPSLQLTRYSGTSATARGENWPPGQTVRLVWEATGATAGTASVSGAGTFGPITITRPNSLPGWPQTVGARDNLGNSVSGEVL